MDAFISSYADLIKQVVIVTSLILFVFVILLSVFSKGILDTSAGVDTIARTRNLTISMSLLLVVFCVGLSWWAISDTRDKTKSDIEKSLKIVLNSTHEVLSAWLNEQMIRTEAVSRDPILVSLVEEQISLHQSEKDLLNSEAQDAFRSLSAQVKRLGYQGFFVIARDGISVASSRDSNIGKRNLIFIKRPDLMERVLNGEMVFVPPIISDVTIGSSLNVARSDKPPTMFFAAPVKDQRGRIIAVLTQRFDPQLTFSKLNQLGRIGRSGETYTFDQRGVLLSESRFVSGLRKIGLLSNQEQSILSIRINDPLVDLRKISSKVKQITNNKLPSGPTKMLASALRGENGVDTQGYRDYRGVLVMGAWVWDERWGIGMATEIDIEEALAPLRQVQIIIATILTAALGLSLSYTVILQRIAQQASRTLMRLNDDLEQRVKLRTQEIETKTGIIDEQQARLRSVIDSIPDLIFLKTIVILRESIWGVTLLLVNY